MHGIRTIDDLVINSTFLILSSAKTWQEQEPISEASTNEPHANFLKEFWWHDVKLTGADIILLNLIMQTIAFIYMAIAFLYTAGEVYASPAKFDSLCAVSGAFSRCSVEFEENQLVFVSIDGFNEMNFCSKKSISYRSNPSSPYKKVSGSESMIVNAVRGEKGIDHDFLFKYADKNSQGRAARIIVRFKNHKVAINFAGKISESTKACRTDT